MTIKIYRAVAKETAFVGKWHTSRKACMAQIRHIQFDYVSSIMFGKNFDIEVAQLEVDEDD